MNSSEQNKAKRQFVPQKSPFSVLNPPTTIFEWKFIKKDRIQLKVSRVYSLMQYTTVANRISR
jgi:hypothetical protein